jgi:glycosyltransferase involved in cell wall biosynthesis
MRICHLGKFYPPAAGGIETHLRTLAGAQARLGAHVQVICVNHRDRSGRDVTWENFSATPDVEEWDGAVNVVRLGRSASIARLDLCPRLMHRLRRLERADFDVLHLHVPNPTMVLTLAAARLRVLSVVSYHSDVVKQRLLAQLQRPFESAVFSRASAILAASPNYRTGSACLRRWNAKVRVFPYGIDLAGFRNPSTAALQAGARFRREHDQPLWLAVGRLVYYKGLDVALRALAKVPGRLLIVGDGPLRHELSALAERLDVASRVIWAGRLNEDELIGAYHAATALWLPSNARSEAFGIVQIEAMACGCPVINTNIPGSGVAWVSQHEETGLTVPINDPESFSAAVCRLIAEPGLRERLSRGARARADAEFDAQVMARRTLAVYEEVADLGVPCPGENLNVAALQPVIDN